MDISAWLRELGLERYDQAFQKGEIDPALLPELTDADLKELGIPLGPRKRLLKAISALATGTEPPSAQEARRTEAERRQLTVMFVDLVGSTALSARLDPEEMREVIRAYQNAVAGEIAALRGARRQVHGRRRARLLRLAAGARGRGRAGGPGRPGDRGRGPDARTPAGEALAARIGIATGLVVVGDLIGEGAAREEAVVGETPNLAARLQALGRARRAWSSPTPPGAWSAACSTSRISGRGSSRASPRRCTPSRWSGERAVEDRFAAHQSGAPLPLVGRDQELALLLDRWRLAKGGEGQVVLLAGEPGIGKSRIVLALRERLRAEPRTSVRYNCSPFHANSALHPVIEQLARAAGFAPEDDAATRLAKLEALVARGGDPRTTSSRTWSTCSACRPTGATPSRRSRRRRRRRAPSRRCWRSSRAWRAGSPVLLVLEDAHWCDPTTLELFDRVVERVASLPVLLVVTFRPEFRPPWAGHAHVTSLALSRLGRAEAGAIVAEVAGGQALPAELLDAIVGADRRRAAVRRGADQGGARGGPAARRRGARYELAGPLPPLAIPDDAAAARCWPGSTGWRR